ncbi:MAG: hypothetical protein Q9166_005907 [cf. Caloplaca sp. 2 TL-2023]
MPPHAEPKAERVLTKPSYPSLGVTQGIFAFGSSGFHINFMTREKPKYLKKMLFPEMIGDRNARKSAYDDAANLIDESWVKAQLQHYGIEFNPDINAYKAKALLMTCVAHSLCDAIPPQVLKIKATLQGAYEAQMNEYRVKMEAYYSQELARWALKFEACTSANEEIRCDPSLFLRKYFLDEHGQPD